MCDAKIHAGEIGLGAVFPLDQIRLRGMVALRVLDILGDSDPIPTIFLAGGAEYTRKEFVL